MSPLRGADPARWSGDQPKMMTDSQNGGRRKRHSVSVCECGQQAFAKTSGAWTVMVSASDAWLIEKFWWTPTLRPNGVAYAISQTAKAEAGSGSAYLHRFVVDFTGLSDHADRNGLNNMRSNLREATKAQNAQNCFRIWRPLPKGVRPYPRGRLKKFSARIRVDGREVSLGYFETAEQASLAYDAAAIANFGEFARTNSGLG